MQSPSKRRHQDGTEQPIVQQVSAAIPQGEPLLLAVSGGRDSMALMEMLARHSFASVRAVATFDHGTGAHAAEASALAAARARELGFTTVTGRAEEELRSEAELRRARLTFLYRESRRLAARLTTAHTEDDQLETIVIRILRGAGARGLAGLYADTGIVRPFLGVTRMAVANWAEAQRLTWVEDPSNRSLRFLRNRVRLELLPALEGAHAGFGREMLMLAHRAAELRAAVDAHASRVIPGTIENGTLIVAREALLQYDSQGLALLWPALAARVGVTLDRRGTARLAAFTIEGRSGGRVQLSGGVEVVRHREELRMRPVVPAAQGPVRPLVAGTMIGGWRFVTEGREQGLWSAELPADQKLYVRCWTQGDRMIPLGEDAPRRLKGLFRDAGVDAAARRGWPVVLADGEIVWVPGVRRSPAAAVRSGRPVVRFTCERVSV
jgi:tRNA(Ile)-lysidine synthase